MLTNGGNTEGLFRGAFMESGSPIPVGDITHGQEFYDALVAETGCTGSADTLQCLREVPFDTLMEAVNQSPGIFSPRVSWNNLYRRVILSSRTGFSRSTWLGCHEQTAFSFRTTLSSLSFKEASQIFHS